MTDYAMPVRFDYVKASINLDYDVAQEFANIWYDNFDKERGINKAQRHANVQSVRRNKDNTFLYVFEAWGETCANTMMLDFATWGPHLHRVDVRGNAEITRDGIDRMYSYLTKHKAGSKNVQLFSSRARSKRNGRDTGGYGIAVGSHKSNLRTTFYVRGTEPGAFEFQCMGTLLTSTVNVSITMGKAPANYNNGKQWDALLMNLWVRGQNDYNSVSGLEEHEQRTLLMGGNQQELEREHTLTHLDSVLDGLSKSELFAVQESIQLRLL